MSAVLECAANSKEQQPCTAARAVAVVYSSAQEQWTATDRKPPCSSSSSGGPRKLQAARGRQQQLLSCFKWQLLPITAGTKRQATFVTAGLLAVRSWALRLCAAVAEQQQHIAAVTGSSSHQQTAVAGSCTSRQQQQALCKYSTASVACSVTKCHVGPPQGAAATSVVSWVGGSQVSLRCVQQLVRQAAASTAAVAAAVPTAVAAVASGRCSYEPSILVSVLPQLLAVAATAVNCPGWLGNSQESAVDVSGEQQRLPARYVWC